jgi:hypothetical protein
LLTEYTVTGTVPDGAVRGNVGFRVNMECDCQGKAAFILEKALYIAGEQATNKVPNGTFGNGLNGWGLWGSGNQSLVSSQYGNGAALQVDAGLTQNAGANSDAFSVTPGEAYTVTFTARVNPITGEAGYFSLFFLNNAGEVSRIEIPIEVGESLLANGTTTQDGSFNINLGDFPAGSYQIKAWFVGTAEYWPAIFIVE